MIGIDTNILVRYLTNDDTEQCNQVIRLFEQYSGHESSIYINNIVLCELVWVLEKGYKYKIDQIAAALKLILQTPEFAFDNHQLLTRSVIEYERSSVADLSDIIITLTNNNNGCSATYSFDKTAIKLGYFVQPPNEQ
jgi:predicted nucleic-acid-binding protein